MSKTFRNVGILLASTCGVLTAYASFRPALEEQKAERLGADPAFRKAHQKDTVISDQMRQDFEEAGKEWREDRGFAWGLRAALRGRNLYAQQNQKAEIEGGGEEARRAIEVGEGKEVGAGKG